MTTKASSIPPVRSCHVSRARWTARQPARIWVLDRMQCREAMKAYSCDTLSFACWFPLRKADNSQLMRRFNLDRSPTGWSSAFLATSCRTASRGMSSQSLTLLALFDVSRQYSRLTAFGVTSRRDRAESTMRLAIDQWAGPPCQSKYS